MIKAVSHDLRWEGKILHHEYSHCYESIPEHFATPVTCTIYMQIVEAVKNIIEHTNKLFAYCFLEVDVSPLPTH